MGRIQPKTEERAGAYFLRPASGLTFIPSGCALLDCVLGGGWVVGRMSNIIGDTSTAKTALAVEACANFAVKFPKGRIYYRENEGAFDRRYAEAMGFPKSAHLWEQDNESALETVEDIFEDIDRTIADSDGQPILYVVDSWDSLSDRAELERAIDEKTFGQDKAKQASRGFRKMIKRVEQSKICLLIISQVRDNIGVTFGERYRRSGGHALNFYASHCLWLARTEIAEETHAKVERATAIHVRARCKKNKVALPFRECDFIYKLGFGIDDIETSINWLAEIGKLELLGVKQEKAKAAKTPEDRKKEKGAKTRLVSGLVEHVNKLPEAEYKEYRMLLVRMVTDLWYEIEKDFIPNRAKYG